MSEKHKKFLRKVGIKEKSVHLGMVDAEIVFAIGKIDHLQEYVAFKFECDKEDVEVKDNVYGYCFSHDGHCPIIWLPRYPLSNQELATLAHECFHAAMEVGRWANIPVDKYTEEFTAHCIRFIMQSFLKLMA